MDVEKNGGRLFRKSKLTLTRSAEVKEESVRNVVVCNLTSKREKIRAEARKQLIRSPKMSTPRGILRILRIMFIMICCNTIKRCRYLSLLMWKRITVEICMKHITAATE
jgi:hypothetical protein